MNHYLAKLRELELAVDQNEGFVSFVSPLTGPKSEKGKPTEAESVTGEGFVSFVSAQNRHPENLKSVPETNRQNCQNPYGRVFEELRSGCPALVETDRWNQAIRDADSAISKLSDAE
jgi:hypothetical protein